MPPLPPAPLEDKQGDDDEPRQSISKPVNEPVAHMYEYAVAEAAHTERTEEERALNAVKVPLNLPPVSTKRFSGRFVLSQAKWHAGDMVKIPKFLGKAGRDKKAEKGRPVDGGTLFKWNHIGSVAKAMLQMMPSAEVVRVGDGPGKMARTCAVVGNGGGLLERELGATIDAHDVVIRFNGGPTVGFEKWVGARTTWRITNTEHFGFQEPRARPAEGGVLQHITNAPALARLIDYATKLDRSKHLTPMYMIDPEFHYYALSVFALGAPSNGFYGTLLAGEICQQVTLFGFQKRWKGQKLKYHYYNDVEPNESQTARDVVEAARFSQWLHAMNKYAVECRPNCDDPRIDTRLTADRVRYAESLASSPPAL